MYSFCASCQRKNRINLLIRTCKSPLPLLRVEVGPALHPHVAEDEDPDGEDGDGGDDEGGGRGPHHPLHAVVREAADRTRAVVGLVPGVEGGDPSGDGREDREEPAEEDPCTCPGSM